MSSREKISRAEGPQSLNIISLHLQDIGRCPLVKIGPDNFDSLKGDKPAQIAKGNVRLSIALAKRHREEGEARGIPFEDLIQRTHVWLIKSAKRYNPKKGCQFSTYFWNRTNRGIPTEIKREKLLPDTSLDTILLYENDNTSEDPLEILLAEEEREAIADTLDRIPAKEERMIRMYHGLDGSEGNTDQEIAQRMGYETRANVNFFRMKGQRKLRRDPVFLKALCRT